MPICDDTIVKIKFLKQTEQDKHLSVWAIDREEDTQAIFEKDEYFAVGGKIVPEKRNDNIRPKMTVATSTRIFINNSIPQSNRCPLKIS
ncbi:7407_t:CDS:2 [Gigaspora rosea]|nr:7407_t:CDS:2 [Gigaspora rosea]